MIACIYATGPSGTLPLPSEHGTPRANKVRHITLFAARRLETPVRVVVNLTLKVQFAQTAFTPAIEIKNHQ